MLRPLSSRPPLVLLLLLLFPLFFVPHIFNAVTESKFVLVFFILHGILHPVVTFFVLI